MQSNLLFFWAGMSSPEVILFAVIIGVLLTMMLADWVRNFGPKAIDPNATLKFCSLLGFYFAILLNLVLYSTYGFYAYEIKIIFHHPGGEHHVKRLSACLVTTFKNIFFLFFRTKKLKNTFDN